MLCFRRQRASECNRFVEQLVGRHSAGEDPKPNGSRRINRTAAEQDIEGRLQARRSRQALRPASTWQQAPTYFRRSQLNAPVVSDEARPARQRQLQSTAERNAVHRRNPRLGLCLKPNELATETTAELPNQLIAVTVGGPAGLALEFGDRCGHLRIIGNIAGDSISLSAFRLDGACDLRARDPIDIEHGND